MSILEIKNIKKSFGEDLEVLQDISLAVEEGEVVSILGPSGSGKSTLLRCATFLEQIDSGSIAYGGKVYVENDTAGNAKKPERAKILEAQSNFGLVFQDFNLFPHFSVLKNVMDAPVKNQKRPKQEVEKEARALLAKMGLEGKEDAYPCELSGGQKQRVAIARALALRPKMLYFDEPTSALTFKEVESLFKVVKDLKAQGIGIIYITHRLDEVFEISTDVGIMRDGRITLMGKIEEFTKAALVKGLLPDATDQQEIVNKNTVDYSKDPVLELKNYSGYGFKDISLKVYPGEILGVAGVVGAGRTEMAQTIFGMDKVLGGKVYLDGNDITGLSTQKVMKAGVNYVSEDRHADGIFKISSVAYNITSGVLSESFMGKVFLNQKKEKSLTQQYIDDFRIKVTGQEQEVGSLSGGNQQKVVIGHALATNPKLIILDEPTRGIDAGARTDVYNIIKGLSKKGLAVLLISSDMEEIIELSDRAVTIHQGRLNCEFDRADINQENLTKASFGVIGKEKES